MKQWESFLQTQERMLGKETVDKWLRPFKVVSFDAGNLLLEPRDEFQVSWFEEHIRPRLSTLFLNSSGRPIRVRFSTAVSKPKKIYKPVVNLQPDSIDTRCQFENYVASSPAADLLKEALEKKSYNPIYLFGQEGVGKTHLLMAAAQMWKHGLYVRAETFTQHVVSAIRSGAMEKFRKFYRSAEALIVDDVHLLANKLATQEEFFHTFNTLHLLGRPLVLSALGPPSMLSGIEPRLTSRFEWGLVLPLQKPSLTQMTTLLEEREKKDDFPLPHEVKEFLLASFLRTPKVLIRAFEALLLNAHLEHLSPSNLTRLKAELFLTKLIEEEKKLALTPEKIVATVAEFYGIKAEDIWGESQTQECAVPRQVSMHLCRTLLKMAFTQIGKKFQRDHSTVMASVKSVQKKIERKELSLDTFKF